MEPKMIITDNCASCVFWDEAEAIDYGERMDNFSATHGLCKKAEFYDGYTVPDIDSPMITKDGSGYFGELYTRCNHSCRSWASEIVNKELKGMEA